MIKLFLKILNIVIILFHLILYRVYDKSEGTTEPSDILINSCLIENWQLTVFRMFPSAIYFRIFRISAKTCRFLHGIHKYEGLSLLAAIDWSLAFRRNLLYGIFGEIWDHKLNFIHTYWQKYIRVINTEKLTKC